jgi:transcriptional regulator with XRE-family HTH domain
MINKITSGYYPYWEKFSVRMQLMRTSKKLSQEELNTLCGFDDDAIKNLEKGILDIGIREALTIAQKLGISLSELLEGTD